MKNKLVAARLLVLLLPLFLPGCASAPAPPPPGGLLVPEAFYIPASDEPLFGTWVNPRLRNKSWYPKVIIHPWGLYEVFGSPSDEAYDWRGTATILEKWTDAQGNLWYRQFVRCSLKNFYSGHCFELDRISPDGGTLECIFGNLAWPAPSGMDPAANSTYVIYSRQ